MKRILFPVVAAGVSLLALSAHAAQDAGQINFEGELTDQTCEVLIDGNAASPALVKLPKLSTTPLQGMAKTAGQTSFLMSLRNCTVKGKKATAFFEYNAGFVDFTNGTLKNLATATPATNVNLQLVDGSTNNAIEVGSQTQTTSNTWYTIDAATGAVDLPYAVQYYATGNATAGKINGSVTYSLQYE